jgi:ElaB/YqjD/DUF883 family membrane-anchored ribosome-binding protein
MEITRDKKSFSGVRRLFRSGRNVTCGARVVRHTESLVSRTPWTPLATAASQRIGFGGAR